MDMSKRRSRRTRGTTGREHARAHNRRLFRGLCEHLGELDNPLDVEQHASILLGQLWQARGKLPPEARQHHAEALGMPVIKDIAHVGGRGARIMLKAISRIEQGDLGVEASQLASNIRVRPDPEWLTSLGCSEVISARAVATPGEAEGIVLEARAPGIRPHAVAVMIDDRLGGIAKFISLISADANLGGFDPSGLGSDGFDLRPVDAVDACRRVRAAIELTDADLHAPVDDGFAELRALALARAHLPAGVEFGPPA